MSWTMLTIRDVGGGGDGVLYPIPGEGPNAVVFDEHDGQVQGPVTATRIELSESVNGGKRKQLLMAEKVKVSVYITDARLVVACSKYDKGGGWYGGVTALALNAGSKAMAAMRRHGKSLVGHVRYPWLSWTGYTTKTGWLSEESLRISAAAKDGAVKHTLYLDLQLPKTTSAEKVAHEITSRAARHRLATCDMEPKVRAEVEALVNPPALVPEPKKYSQWMFPEYFFARESTAFGKRDSSIPGNPPTPKAAPPAPRMAVPPPPPEEDEPELDIRLY